jgi:phage tail-like protein
MSDDADGRPRPDVRAPMARTQPLDASNAAERAAPRVASVRAYLRGALPAIYQDHDFVQRFLYALERLLDPTLGVLDALPSYFAPALTRSDVLELVAVWLGVEFAESAPEHHKRESVGRAADATRVRGTKSGVEASLRTAFPDLPLAVEDLGGVNWETSRRTRAPEGAPGFVVRCDAALDEGTRIALTRAIERAKPVHVPYELRSAGATPEPSQVD